MGQGMGKLDPDEKYVVTFEIYGPATKSTGDRFDSDLAKLMGDYGGQIRLTWHASKSNLDPLPPVDSDSGEKKKTKKRKKKKKSD